MDAIFCALKSFGVHSWVSPSHFHHVPLLIFQVMVNKSMPAVNRDPIEAADSTGGFREVPTVYKGKRIYFIFILHIFSPQQIVHPRWIPPSALTLIPVMHLP